MTTTTRPRPVLIASVRCCECRAWCTPNALRAFEADDTTAYLCQECDDLVTADQDNEGAIQVTMPNDADRRADLAAALVALDGQRRRRRPVTDADLAVIVGLMSDDARAVVRAVVADRLDHFPSLQAALRAA